MSRLFVVGDSFSAPGGSFVPQGFDSPNTWIEQVADRMNLELVNDSLIGCALDYQWLQIHKWLDQDLNPTDRIIVVLTDPWRYWYFNDLPEASNTSIVDLKDFISPEKIDAVEKFILHIQRIDLIAMACIHRLAWLDRTVQERGLAKPLVIKAFDQTNGEAEFYKNYVIAKGNLHHNIQRKEYIGYKSKDKNYNFSGELLKGIDPRYNHMCLRNHKVLADKVVDFFQNDIQVDLETGFHEEIIDKEVFNDNSFWNNELIKTKKDSFMAAQNLQQVVMPWDTFNTKKYSFWDKIKLDVHRKTSVK